MNDLSDFDRATIRMFLAEYFPEPTATPTITSEEQSLIADVVGYVDQRFSGMAYILGLALDFVLIAQRLSGIDPEAKVFRPSLTSDDIFARYPRVTERNRRTANTLTLVYQGTQVGIRRIEEKVVQLFHQLKRTGYPNAYVYNTGQWTKNLALLEMCFRLSEVARLEACRQLLEYGLGKLPVNTFFGRPSERVRLFGEIITRYPRTGPKENAGLTFQALAYAFIVTDRGHLEIIADKVRTGSARQRRIGDIDGYHGLDLELSVEVKYVHIDTRNVDRELAGFVSNVENYGIFGVALIRDIHDDARRSLEDRGVIAFTEAQVEATVRTWDWRKQDAAIHAMLHYLAHIEQNVGAVNRLLSFISERDSAHESLIYFQR